LDAAALVQSGRYDSGLPASWATGDYTYDGVVDIMDISAVIAGGLFDAGAYSPSGLVAVPEPTTTWAAVAATVAAVIRRLRLDRS